MDQLLTLIPQKENKVYNFFTELSQWMVLKQSKTLVIHKWNLVHEVWCKVWGYSIVQRLQMNRHSSSGLWCGLSAIKLIYPCQIMAYRRQADYDQAVQSTAQAIWCTNHRLRSSNMLCTKSSLVLWIERHSRARKTFPSSLQWLLEVRLLVIQLFPGRGDFLLIDSRHKSNLSNISKHYWGLVCCSHHIGTLRDPRSLGCAVRQLNLSFPFTARIETDQTDCFIGTEGLHQSGVWICKQS